MLKLPPSIYCPKCGKTIEVKEAQLQVIKKQLYTIGGTISCPCGVTGLILGKKLPESPTWTIVFDIYKKQ